MEETIEEAIAREVKEETGLALASSRYLFSVPNVYRYSHFDIPTLDAFFLCTVADASSLKAADDAAEVRWVALSDIHTEQFGLRSIRQALFRFFEMQEAK